MPAPPAWQLACPWFRKSFTLPPSSSSAPALLYVASVGYHELTVNGKAAAPPDAVLLPSISYLPKRVLYRTYNVTALLNTKAGAENVLGLWVSAGWGMYPDLHHGLAELAPLVLARLEVDGFSVVTDSSWLVHESTTEHLGPWGSGFGGDAVDDSKAIPGWDTAGYAPDTSWGKAESQAIPASVLISADAMESTVKHSTVPAADVKPAGKSGNPHQPPPPPGSWLIEMAEVYTGWFELHNMTGAPKSTVRFQISTTAGTILEYSMEDTYTFGAIGTGSFRMRFAYHEIQYITVSGLTTKPQPSDVVGYRLTSLGDRTGAFSCSSELITKMYTTTVNNYRGLTTGGMTVDCPHRERRGYGGDGHTSYQFALANFPVGAYFNKWTRDFADTSGVAGASDTRCFITTRLR
jgi:alpha-L-rhamnosidase